MSTVQIAQIRPLTEAEGPGKRMAIWVQGCPLRCHSCCNPEMLSFEGGTAWQTTDLINEAAGAQTEHQIEGVTLLGGEPFAHAEQLAEFAEEVSRRHALTVMVFSGYTLAEIQAMDDAHSTRLLKFTDILVDGPFDPTQPDTNRRWIGSTNQQIHFLTERYVAHDPCWHEANTLEIQWQDGVLSVNGFPAPHAIGLWKRPSQ